MADNFTLSNLSPGSPPEAFGPGSSLSTNVDKNLQMILHLSLQKNAHLI